MEEILNQLEKENVEVVRFENSDMFGISRSKLIPARHFRSKAEKGVGFRLGYLGMDSLANIVEGSGYNNDGKYRHYPDAILFPDLDTFRVIPWWDNTARILAEPTFEGKEVTAHPRTLARKQIEELKKLGYSLLSSHEYEFYVVDAATMKPVTDDYNIRSTIRMYECAPFVHQLVRDLPKVGLDLECIENEYGPGQHEITYKPSFGIKAADDAFTFKCSVKEIAKQHGLMASFMTKPHWGKSGSSCHYNHSLWDVAGKKGVTFDANSSDGLSDVMKHWLAGLIHHTPALSLLMGPTTNCRKRYAPYTFAPINATWGFDNRSCAFRLKVNGESGTYIENRIGGAGSNPYLVLAATIAAGMDGIINKLPLPNDITGCAYVEDDVPPSTQAIPITMQTAIDAFLKDKVIRNAFGEDFTKCFVAIKEHEIRLANQQAGVGIENLNKWEIQQYFKYI
ncbi:lengsin-like [Antedon mediterranea]|uniref:lengsin-like n=1 Tax=Antedon mediterranea TaxID=105859 RepID=UPI003AF9AD44